MNQREAKQKVLALALDLLYESFDPEGQRGHWVWTHDDNLQPLSSDDRYRLISAGNDLLVELARRSKQGAPPELEHLEFDHE